MTFVSTTAGDYDGLFFEAEINDTTRIEFTSDIATFMFDPSKLSIPQVIELGGVELALEMVPVYTQKYPDIMNFSYTDPTQDIRKAAYHVKVTQIDGEKAWSSPIFVNWAE